MNRKMTDDVFYYVAYARVSTDEQRNGESVESQITRINTWISSQEGSWINVADFLEDYTGYEYNRPELDIVLELAKAGKINAMIVAKRDRFARDSAVSSRLETDLSKLGIRLFSVKEGEFTKGVKNRYVNAIERESSEEVAETLKENMRTMRYHYIDNGAMPSQGIAVYGYEKAGKKAASTYIINENEAAVVRFIFDMYIERMSFQAIADELNNQQIQQPASKTSKHRHVKLGWNKRIVQHIIHNLELYHGVFTAYKHAIHKDAPDVKTINIPAIISDDIYVQAVYLREQSKSTFFNPNTNKRNYLSLGHITCKCGYSFSGHKSDARNRKTGAITSTAYYYRCNSTFDKSRGECDIKFIKADILESVLWDFISSIITNPKAALARYKQQEVVQQKVIDNALAHLETIDELINELSVEKEQVIKLFRKRMISEERLDNDVLVIDRQLEKLSNERAKWFEILEQYKVNDSKILSLEAISTQLRDNINNVSIEEKRRILDKLRVKVTISKEDTCVILYVSLLGSTSEKLTLLSTCDSDTSARNSDSFTSALIFRLVIK